MGSGPGTTNVASAVGGPEGPCEPAAPQPAASEAKTIARRAWRRTGRSCLSRPSAPPPDAHPGRPGLGTSRLAELGELPLQRPPLGVVVDELERSQERGTRFLR